MEHFGNIVASFILLLVTVYLLVSLIDDIETFNKLSRCKKRYNVSSCHKVTVPNTYDEEYVMHKEDLK